MKDKLLNFYKKNKLATNTGLIVFTIGLIILTSIIIINNNKLKEYNTNTYSIVYDKSWKRKNKTDKTIELKHKSKSEIKIEVVNLNEQYKYLDSKELIDELLYSIGLENKDYKLLQKKQINVTKNNYDGYKVLYENNINQVMVVIAKKSDKVLLLTYEAPNEYFDILLDSVQNIIYNFEIKDEVYKIKNTVEVETTPIKWKENKELTKSIKKNKSHEIANSNYAVKLSIPSNFKIANFQSTYGYYNYQDLKQGSITLNVSIYEKNIFEYLSKEDKYGNLYNEFKIHREKTNKNYTNFEETMTKLENKNYEAYLYKAEYDYKGYSSINKYENYYMIYELDENHILIFKLVSIDNIIPKELLDKLKFSDVTNYASNIDRVVKDNKLITKLKKFKDYKKEQYVEITLKLPTAYKEFDKLTNNNAYRYFSLNHDQKNDIYQYDVKYSLSDLDDKSKIISNIVIYKNTGYYQPLISNGTTTLNNKTFELYTGGYNDYGPGYNKNNSDENHYVQKYVLLYKIETGGHLVIEIDGNGSEISNEVLNDLTNIDIMIKEYK